MTVTVKLTGVAHNPAVGVNTYVPEFWLSTKAGIHVPVIAFVDVFGSVGTLAPAQIDKEVPKAKVGRTFGSTVNVNDVVIAHWPASGVNIYVPEF